jgi:hypothetical protein
LTDIRVFAGRNSVGVRGISLGEGDHVISMSILRHSDATPAERTAYLKQAAALRRQLAMKMKRKISRRGPTEKRRSSPLTDEQYAEMAEARGVRLTVSEFGYGKRSSSYDFRVSGRGGKGIRATDTSKNGEIGTLVASFPVEDSDQIMLVTNSGKVIRVPVEGIRFASRATKGVKIFTTAEGEHVVSVERIREPEDIDGEAGVGFVLKPGFMLPPLMFSEDEIEALVLGSRWVAERTDQPLGQAARNALVKIAAVLPPDLKAGLDESTLMVGPGAPLAAGESELPVIRDAVRRQRKLTISYADVNGNCTDRVIWPIALAFFDQARVIVAWCELRDDFRHFRADRILGLKVEVNGYPQRRAVLMKQWQEKVGLHLRKRRDGHDS